LYTLDKSCIRTKTDQTLEIIMTELDPEKMKIFYQEYTSSATEATKVKMSNVFGFGLIVIFVVESWYR